MQYTFPSFSIETFSFFFIITFQVHVEALGYVGFGISPNGGMTEADVVIGWVLDHGTPVFHVSDMMRTEKYKLCCYHRYKIIILISVFD